MGYDHYPEPEVQHTHQMHHTEDSGVAARAQF